MFELLVFLLVFAVPAGLGVLLWKMFRGWRPSKPVNVALVLGIMALIVGTCVTAPETPLTEAGIQAEAQARAEAQKLAELEAEYGPKPTRSPWTGHAVAVGLYLKKVARDPDSVEVAYCTPLLPNTNFNNIPNAAPAWHTACTWRGRNGFGGMSLDAHHFNIRDNRVVRMEPWDLPE